MKKEAVWFSRHQPTAEQVADAAAMGYEITVTPQVTEMASKSLESSADVEAAMKTIHAAPFAVFGVFAAPVQAEIIRRMLAILEQPVQPVMKVPLFAAAATHVAV